MGKKVCIDSGIRNHIKRLNLESSVVFADEKTTDLANEIKEFVKENGASYYQARNALVLADEIIYRNLIKQENPFKEKQTEPVNEPKKEEAVIRVTQEGLESAELTIDPELPEKLKTELCELSKEFFNKVLAVKKELLPSMKEEELVFLHKQLSEFRRGLLSDGFDANFHIGQILTDAILITFSDENLESSD
jgi:hypothetical protein